MKKAILVLAMLSVSAAAADAQVKNRWKLGWSNEKPKLYTYRSPNDKYENYWYFTFTLENGTDEIVPLIVDTMLYTETGKEYQNELRKVDTKVVREGLENPGFRPGPSGTGKDDAKTIHQGLASLGKSEQLKFGRFYPNVINPEAEYKIIEYHSGIGNRSDGIVRESIEAFKKGFTEDPPAKSEFAGKWKKGDRLYLNPREIREHRFLQPGQRIMGIAIFKDVDPRAQVYEVHVSGLIDIIKITVVNDDEWRMEYEPQTLRLRWERVGDEFNIERDVLYRLVKHEFVIKKIGPVAAKDTLDKLVNGLADTLRKEKDWEEKKLTADQVREQRASDGIDDLDTRIMAMIVGRALGKDFGYDYAKDVMANEKIIWRIHEWWITNRAKLLFNEATNRFEIKDDVLPGTIQDK